MKKLFATFRVGTRASKLALLQTEQSIARLKHLLPDHTFAICPLTSPGDRDRKTDLRESPADFFTRDLDEALFRGDLDFAIHSAKDMPDPAAAGLDWFWLPWREDARDCLIFSAAWRAVGLPSGARIGVSSERRMAYCRNRFPTAQLLPIRGDIEQRLAQLDAGHYDALIMAGAALLRLDLQTRIDEWIPTTELPTPAGQGALGVSFRLGDPRLTRLRTLFTRPALFVGAGAGSAGMCTSDGLAALKACEVCIHDALLDPFLLTALPADAERIDAGKRAASCTLAQDETTALILQHLRRGRRVVRLKGGDPGIFGRLAEETEALQALGLPFWVLPGVSSLNAATTGTGILLTRRGGAHGFCALSARREGGASADVSASARARLPVVFFMAGRAAAAVTEQLQRDGWPNSTPAAAVFAAGSEEETIVAGTLENLASRLASIAAAADAASAGNASPSAPAPPVLLICGAAAAAGFRPDLGALRGQRVLITCSETLQARAVALVRDYGGIPVARPLIRLSPCLEETSWLCELPNYAWVVLTSPSAVDGLMQCLRQAKVDLRRLPRLLVAGPGTAARLAEFGLQADAQPSANYGAAGLLACARGALSSGERVLRLRSNRAGTGLTLALRELGLSVDDVVLYRNEPVHYDCKPRFELVLFASGSTVEAFLAEWGPEALAGKIVAAFPGSACAALAKAGVSVAVQASESTLESCVGELALHEVRRALEE